MWKWSLLSHKIFVFSLLYFFSTSGTHYSVSFRRNLPYASSTFLRLIHNDITKHTYMKMNIYRDNGTRKMSSSCSSTYCNYLNWCIFHVPCRSSLEPVGKASPMEVSVIHRVDGNQRTIFMQLLRVLLA
jgi:hypothetical protein